METARGAWVVGAVLVLVGTACGDGGASTPPDPPDCRGLGAGDVLELGVTTTDDEVLLTLPARALSATSWAIPGQEALILDVTAGETSIGQLVLHQGARPFDYAMTLGHLAAGVPITARLSSLSAPVDDARACLGDATITPGATLGAAAEGLARAPVFKWPVAKRFDDLPLVLGWSQATRGFEIFYSNENGGTTALCGDPLSGMQLLYARWGRGFDVERVSTYEPDTWLRCTGVTPYAEVAPRLEGQHPIFYYGDGHNRLYEDRGGYGATCGRGLAERADGAHPGWNIENPGDEPALDDGLVITVRPAPLALDPIGYDLHAGRREGLADRAAPWLYRLTADELTREDKLDGTQVRPLEGYLYVDVHTSEVNGVGGDVCGTPATMGFQLTLRADDPATPGSELMLASSRMTASYARGDNWKRLAIPLPDGVDAASISAIVFDALEGDGIVLHELGDAFRVLPDPDGGVTLDVLLAGTTPVDRYVVDDDVGCTDGVNPDGPGGLPIDCATSVVEIPTR